MDRAIVAQTPQQKMEAANKVREWSDALDALIEIESVQGRYMYRHRQREVPEKSALTVRASANMYHRLDPLHEFVKKVKPIPGFEDYGIHGDKYGFVFKDADGKGSHRSVKEFAKIIKESGTYKGGDIRLLSCETGSEGSVVAQGLADELGVRVLAPSDVLYIHYDGSMTIGNILTSTGEWIIFEPKK